MTTVRRTRTVSFLLLAALAALSSMTRAEDNGGTPRLILVPTGGRIGFDTVDSHALIVNGPQGGGTTGAWFFGNQNRAAIAQAISDNLGNSVDSDQFEWIVDFVYDSLTRNDLFQIPTMHVTSDGIQETSVVLDTRGVVHKSPRFVVPTGPHGKVLVLGQFKAYSFNQSDLIAFGYCPDSDEPDYDHRCGDWTLAAPEFDFDLWKAIPFYVAIGWFNN